jgi:hypothetical protein
MLEGTSDGCTALATKLIANIGCPLTYWMETVAPVRWPGNP